MKKKMENQALEYLNDLVEKGREYPDAFFTVSQAFNLSEHEQELLQHHYDTQD